MPESKTPSKRYWEPSKARSSGCRTRSSSATSSRASCRRRTGTRRLRSITCSAARSNTGCADTRCALKAGEFCLFWGGLPHQVVDTSNDAVLRRHPSAAGAFLPAAGCRATRAQADARRDARHRPARTAPIRPTARAGSRYLRSSDRAQVDHAISELLLRIERIRFEPFYLVEPDGHARRSAAAAPTSTPSRNIAAICDYIAGNFRHDIDCADIATSVDIHPKYAMSLFKKIDRRDVERIRQPAAAELRAGAADAGRRRTSSRVASESGFGSLSNFNKCFRKIAGMSPTDFRRDLRVRPNSRALSCAPSSTDARHAVLNSQPLLPA